MILDFLRQTSKMILERVKLVYFDVSQRSAVEQMHINDITIIKRRSPGDLKNDTHTAHTHFF